MEIDNSAFNTLNQLLKKNKINIMINDLDKNIFSKLINSKNIIDKITNNKKIMRTLNTLLFSTKNKNYKFKENLNIGNNKFIFMLISVILSLINRSQNNIFENATTIAKNNKIFNYMFLLIFKIYKNKLISFENVTLFFHFYLDLMDQSNITLRAKIEKIVVIISVYKKFLKIMGILHYNNTDDKLKKSINKNIYDVLRRIFLMNNNNNINNFKFTLYFSQEVKILELLKIIYDYYNINIISDDNKRYIKLNLIKLFTNNFNKIHFDYLYSFSNKILKNFNNKNSNKTSYNNIISFINGINEFILEIYKNETIKIQKNEYYVDKYFIFDNNESTNGIKVSPIKFDKNLYNGFSILFSFYAIKNTTIYNKPQLLLAFRKEDNNNFLFKLQLIGNKMYIVTYHSKEEKKSILMENIVYHRYNICIIHYDKSLNCIYTFINRETNVQVLKLDINSKTNLYVEVGHTNNLDGMINDIFNGIIGPVLIFNSNLEPKNHQEILQQNIMLDLKGQYYLIGETMNMHNKTENGRVFLGQSNYYSKSNNKINLINKLQNKLGRLLLYLNPEVVLNTIGYQMKNKFRDYQKYFYFNAFNNIQILEDSKVYYYFSTQEKISDFPKKENDIISSIMNNSEYNLIIFHIEYIYNYLLITDKDKYNDINFITM